VLLLDATVWVALAAPEERFHRAAEDLVGSPSQVAALDLTLYEVANAIGARMGMPDRARRMHSILLRRCGDDLVRVDAKLMADAVAIAAEFSLTAYDAAYVAAARRHGWTLVSGDVADLVSKGLAVPPDAALYP
jgi:predicted nucleic acid-binding protein